MTDRIELRNIRAFGHHGCTPGERESEQPFDINLVLEMDLSVAAASDSLSDSVDYAVIYADVVKIVSSTSFNLLEKLAAKILDNILTHKLVQSARISIGKPGLLDGSTAIVTIERVNAKV
jgi:FolB domain-containing protein